MAVGILNILETGDRKLGLSWVNLKELNVSCGELVNSLFIDSTEEGKSKQEIHCLLLSIISPQELKDGDLYQNINEDLLSSKISTLHIIYWFTFEFNDDSWELSRERRIVGSKSLEYLSLDRKGKGVVLLSHDSYELVFDSVVPVQKAGETSTKGEKEQPKYFFMQDNEEIKLWVNIGCEIAREDLQIDVHSKDVKILVKGATILDKTFADSVESYATTWTLEKNGKLEICFVKSKDNFRWPQLFEGDDKEGEELFDPTLVEEIHNRLAHLTSDQWNSNTESEKPAFNPGQLEECDNASEDLILYVIDGTSHKISHSSHLGAVQHLFNVQLERSVIPSFCLRHDVDGLLWEHDEERNFDHIATFNAFGYVKASKSMAKYTQASPNNSYVAVADLKSHVYVFFQKESLGGELRNRKSGKVSTSIARQLIISLRNHDQVMGFYCSLDHIFVLTASELFVYSLQNS
ncbi:NudC domain-containing protein 1 [Armadillidium vulgare]|nr:NudC domain-containing protein 1 [Armadillidium vulgare]